MAESLGQPEDFGWFTPSDLKLLFRAVHKLEHWDHVILVGGQALVAWVEYFKIDLPRFDGPYLTADADFLGTKAEADIIAKYLNGRAVAPNLDDQTPNTALIEFIGEGGRKLIIDMLAGVLGVSDTEITKLAVPIQLNDWEPVHVLHPLLVLESRCVNLERLVSKRNGNGITQAKVACLVVEKYLHECLASSSRKREALKAAKRIASLARASSGIFVWKKWGIDVMSIIDASKMPNAFARSWAFEVARVQRKREIITRLQKSRPGIHP